MKTESNAAKVLLFLILLAAFLIRLWGLQFEQGETLFNNDAGRLYLRWAQRFYQGNINPAQFTGYYHNICYPFFAQYLMGAAGWIYAGLRYAAAALAYITMSGPFGFNGVLSFTEQVMVGRLLQILLSTGIVYLIYRLGLNLLGRETALVGAFFAAFMPQVINHSRYLQSDITVTFFVTLTVLFSSYILTRGNLMWYLLAGLAAGFSVGAKHNGALAVLAPLGAHFGRVWASRNSGAGPVRHRRLIAVVLSFLLGVGISYPVIWMDWGAFRNAIPRFWWTQLITDKRGTVTGTFWHHRWINIRRFAADVSSRKIGAGLWICILGILGITKICKTRKINELFLIFFPLTYLPAVLVFRGNVRHKDFLPATIFIPLLAATFLVWLVHAIRLPGRLKRAAVWVLTLGVVLPSLLSDVQAAYCCWRRDTRLLSGDWVWENIAPGSRVALEHYTPRITSNVYEVVSKQKYLCLRPLALLLDHGVEYVITSNTAHERFFDANDTFYDEGAQAYYRELDRRFPVKTFRIDNTGFVDPLIKIYYLEREGPEWKGKTTVLRDLDFAYSETSPEIMTLEADLGYEGKSGFWVRGEEPVERLLISPEKLDRVGLIIHPTLVGSGLKAMAGGEEQTAWFDTLEPRVLFFSPRVGFPFLDYSYRVRAESIEGDPFLVKIITSPRQLEHYGGEGAAREETTPIPGPDDFDGWFADYFREDAGWWRQKYSRALESEELAFPEGRDEYLCGASGGGVITYQPERDVPGCFVWGPYEHLPPRPWIASFRLRAGDGGERDQVAVIEVTADQGKRILASRALSRAGFPDDGFREFPLPFDVDYLGNPVEFRVIATGDTPLWSDRLTIYPDLPAWFSRNYPHLPFTR